MNPLRLQNIPVHLKTQTSFDSLHSLSTCAVSVNYCVLRPKEENDT